MYAVIEQGGKQYKVAEGDVLRIDLTDVPDDVDSVQIDRVLCVGDAENTQLGRPYIKGARVIAKFRTTAEDAIVKGPKLYPAHLRRRKNSRRRVGHRQKYLEVVIDRIEAGKS